MSNTTLNNDMRDESNWDNYYQFSTKLLGFILYFEHMFNIGFRKWVPETQKLPYESSDVKLS